MDVNVVAGIDCSIAETFGTGKPVVGSTPDEPGPRDGTNSCSPRGLWRIENPFSRDHESGAVAATADVTAEEDPTVGAVEEGDSARGDVGPVLSGDAMRVPSGLARVRDTRFEEAPLEPVAVDRCFFDTPAELMVVLRLERGTPGVSGDEGDDRGAGKATPTRSSPSSTKGSRAEFARRFVRPWADCK